MKQTCENYTGKLITIEGPDGSGKSTQVSFIAESFREKGYEVIKTREPGGPEASEKIRSIILSGEILPLTEVLLFAASRYEHTEKTIKPALREGKIVISDRFFDSSFAYQAIARGLFNEVLDIQKIILNGFEPHHTLYFDCPYDLCQQRLLARSGTPNALDLESEAFKRLVYQGYKIAFDSNPHRMHRIDASQTFENIREQIKVVIDKFANIK